MSSGFSLLFWGLLLLFPPLYIKGIDILPDFIGYILIFRGLQYLVSESKYFVMARKISFPLIVLSLINIYNFQYHYDLFVSISYVLDIIKAIVLALNIYLVYNLCSGTIELAEARDNDYMANTVKQRWYVYLGAGVVFIVLSLLSFFPFSGELAAKLQVLFWIVYLIYLFAFLIIVTAMYKMKKELSPRPAPQTAKSKTGKSTGKPKRKR